MSTERLLETFLEMVRIDSPTGEEGAFARRCASLLAEAGCSVRFDGAAEAAGSDTGNLIAILPGTVAGRTLVLSGHLDTVEPGRGIEPVLLDGVVTSAGDTVLGADDKAGVAVVVECLRRLAETGAPHADIRIVLTVAEEMGLRGAKALAAADVAGDLCLVLDADGTPGGIVVGAPSHHTFRAVFAGRAAHAGVEPEKGVSAILMATRAIGRMPLGRVDDITTANIGTIAGGVRTNVVAAECVVTGECRSIDAVHAEEVRAEMHAAMLAAAAELGGAVEVAWVHEYPALRFADDDPDVALVEEACRAAGVEPRRFTTGGGSDGNIIAGLGIPALVLSSGMRDVHGMSESVAVADMEAMVGIVASVIARMAGGS